MKRNRRLAAAVAADGRRRYEIAAFAGMSPAYLAHLVAGRYPASPEQQERLAEVLGVDVTVLFGSDALVVAVA